MAGRQFQILGALGQGTFAPLLARERWQGGARAVVLGRPAPGAAGAVSSCRSDRVVGEEGRVRLEGRVLGVYRYVPGLDLNELLERTDGSLPSNALEELAAGVRAALEASPVPHGALSGAAIRIGATGVRLVGFTGRPADDLLELEGLIQEIEVGPEGHSLVELLPGADEPELLPHPWTGRDLGEVSEKPGPPPKARTAGIAALTLVLGLLAGKMLFSG